MDVRTCEQCGKKFVLKRGRLGRFCSRACYWAVGPRGPRKETVKGSRMQAARGHPIAPPSGIVATARLVLYEKIGPGPQACHWCGESVAWMAGAGLAKGALIADHLDHDWENNRPENIVPSCNSCNAHRTRMGDRRLIRDGEPVVVISGRRTRAIEVTCEGCGAVFLDAPSVRAARIRQGRKPQRFCSIECYGRHC